MGTCCDTYPTQGIPATLKEVDKTFVAFVGIVIAPNVLVSVVGSTRVLIPPVWSRSVDNCCQSIGWGSIGYV